jgi:hypothetical protein
MGDQSRRWVGQAMQHLVVSALSNATIGDAVDAMLGRRMWVA